MAYSMKLNRDDHVCSMAGFFPRLRMSVPCLLQPSQDCTHTEQARAVFTLNTFY